ncbi:hypothetical protein [Nocardia brasiliensis]|uniref:hypothetical protein n=1 Tax=Nocardia brasiliensis TaxID=37326 RepID=UPI0011DE27B7|nr:hypothetical protein [Nocardia brasiliensis]
MDFDNLYHFTQEMNKNWRALIDDIDSGRYHEKRAASSRQIPVIDPDLGHSYGLLSVDGNGFLQTIGLSIDDVVQSNEADVLRAICAAINSPAARPAPVLSDEGGNLHG